MSLQGNILTMHKQTMFTNIDFQARTLAGQTDEYIGTEDTVGN